MPKCCLCSKKKETGMGTFFKVPIEERRRTNWNAKCKIVFQSNALVCADHFSNTDLIRGPKRMKLMPNSVPSLNIGIPPSLPSNEEQRYGSTIKEENDSMDETSMLEITMNTVPALNQKVVDYKVSHTQTDSIVLKCLMEIENSKLKEEIKKLKEENADLKDKLNKSRSILNNLGSIFTEGQIRKIMIPGINIKWNWSDISNLICLHAAGTRAYNHLYQKGFPLPHVSTLQRWYRKVDIKEGILTAAIDLMRHVTDLTNDEKICVLAFDEMKVTEAYEFDQAEDCVAKPGNNVQVAMVRGLKKSWKQPIFFDFDCEMTKDLINSIISVLSHAGFPVVAVVCDIRPTNQKLWKSLDATHHKPWFPHPSNPEEKVFVFADTPHLLKLIRNHFLDTGLLWKGEIITSRAIEHLMKHTSKSDTSIPFKLTDEHLAVKGAGRQEVKLAAQLFSNTTANAIRGCYSLGLDLYKPTEAAEMIQLVNDWFDVMNSTKRNFGYPGKEPCDAKLLEQEQIIPRMNEFMSSPIIPGKKDLEHFQRGVLLTNAAMVMLHQFVTTKYNMDYILTNRVNQDSLEHLFSALRKNSPNNHPTRLEFKYRLRKYILARNIEHMQGTGYDTTDWLGVSNQQSLQVADDSSMNVNNTLNISEDESEFIDEMSVEDLKDFAISFNEPCLETSTGLQFSNFENICF